MTHHVYKIAIVGAGAIGGWLGVGLAQAGCQVSVLARGATLAALQHHGLRLGDTTVAVQASNDAHTWARKTWWCWPSKPRRCATWCGR